MFKILTTLGVFIVVSVWAFRNLRYINDWLVEKTGIGMTSAERQAQREAANNTANTSQ